MLHPTRSLRLPGIRAAGCAATRSLLLLRSVLPSCRLFYLCPLTAESAQCLSLSKLALHTSFARLLSTFARMHSPYAAASLPHARNPRASFVVSVRGGPDSGMERRDDESGRKAKGERERRGKTAQQSHKRERAQSHVRFAGQ